jgi:hypothetical protein
MKQFSKKLFSLVVLCSTANVMLQADCGSDNGDRVVPFLQWRSQGRDTARKLYGTTSYAVYQPDMDGVYGTFNVTLQYDQSFRNKEITQALFGASLRGDTETTTTNGCSNDCSTDCNRFITISGLENADGTPNTDRGDFEWMAENFYLPRDFKSTISFSPKVQDVVVDFNLFVGLDRWVSGLYFRLYGPVVWNKAKLDACEKIIEEGTQGYEAGYFGTAEIDAEDLFPDALSFFGGCAPTDLATASGLTVQPLKFAKFSNCKIPATTTTNNCTSSCDTDCGSSRHKTGFAELRGEFGWNYIQERYRLLLNIQAAAPTGSRPNAEFLFPAQIGNGKHWELGVGVGGAWRMWGSEDGEKSFNFIVEADVTHLFKAKQTRTFDLKGKPMSRYMLAEKLQPTADVPVAQQLVAPGNSGFQFAGEYAPVANLTTRDVKVSIGAQGDVVAMFNYTCRGFSWDLGYNFWGMSASSIHVDCNESSNCPDTCPTVVPFLEDTWALKGDAYMFGYQPLVGGVATTNPAPLGATESEATIFTGTNVDETNPFINTGIDSPQLAATVSGPLFEFNTANQVNTSVPPVFIAADDFDFEGAEQRGISHKVFTHFSYTWTNHDRWVPYVGAGFSAEFGSHSHHNDCDTEPATTIDDCPSSLSFALSKWAVEIKGGVSFH